MGRVRVLEDSLINKIAAGEVVADPASVVKELLENSIDAGATRISIAIEGGGAEKIRIDDNGSGMSAEDARLALERHATSKLASEDDLPHIATMGFRGEALPSIAAVSRIEIRTRTTDSNEGTRLYVEGGQLTDDSPCAAQEGTSITVSDLFFNTPARRKFLKSPATLTRNVVDTVARALMARPDVAFRLTTRPRGKPIYSSPGTGQLADALATVLGPEDARGMLPFGPRDHAELGYRISGYLSRPDLHRATRSGLYLFVNRRPISSRTLSGTIASAYQAYLPHRRWPVVALFIEANHELVDVNVSPQKTEVRLASEHRLAGLVGATVRDALAAERRPDQVVSQLTGGSSLSEGLAPRRSFPDRAGPSTFPAFISPHSPRGVPGQAPLPGSGGSAPPREAPRQGLLIDAPPPDPSSWEHVTILGQVFRTFILGSQQDRLYLFDQHTAHERVLYERCLARFSRGEPQRQALLVPHALEARGLGETQLGTLLKVLESCGFEADLFSGGTLVVKAVPVFERPIDLQAVLSDLTEELDAGLQSMERRIQDVAKIVSCRSAVKAGDSLEREDMEAILKDLALTENPLRCPHGRTVMVQLTHAEVKRLFDRTW